MVQDVTIACKLTKEPLATLPIQKTCAASWYDQIELVSGNILWVELQMLQLLKDTISNY